MKTLVICALFCLARICGAQTQPALCPRHIEPPFYPGIAQMAHESGKVIMEITINADGKVEDARVANKNAESVKLLTPYSLQNIRSWTFVKPPTAPYIETITYDYEETDASGKVRGPQVIFDLPDLVTIWAGLLNLQTSQSAKR